MALWKVELDVMNHLAWAITGAAGIFILNKLRAKIIKVSCLVFLNFRAFSFGIIDDRIINIIRIPPVNNSKKIIGNHALAILVNIIKNLIMLKTTKLIVSFTGFIVADRHISMAIHNNIEVIILFSLIKVSVLGIEDYRGIFGIFILFCRDFFRFLFLSFS